MFSQFNQSLANCEDLSTKLASEGYAVVDNLFDEDLLCSLRGEIELLDNSEWLDPSGNKLQHEAGEEGRTIVNKPGVFERSIMMKNAIVAGEATLEMVPNISEFYYQRDRIVECLCNNTKLSITALDQVKLARIQEGGAFMVHTDTTPAKDRVLTMTLYLNSAKTEYDPLVDGGQLRLYPLTPQCEPTIIDVHPVFGRAVLFSSNHLPHRVLPSLSECRYCISFFFFGESVFPVMEVSPLEVSSVLSAEAAQHNSIILEMFRLKYPNESSQGSFTDITFNDEDEEEEEHDFSAVTDQVQDEVVRAAMLFFKQKCDQLAHTIDVDFKDFITVAREYLISESFRITTLQ